MENNSRIIKRGLFKQTDLNELVDDQGAFIDGDDTYNSTTELRTAPKQTMDKFVKTTRQVRAYPYGSSPYSRGRHGIDMTVGMTTGDLEPEYKTISSDDPVIDVEDKEALENLIRKLIKKIKKKN